MFLNIYMVNIQIQLGTNRSSFRLKGRQSPHILVCAVLLIAFVMYFTTCKSFRDKWIMIQILFQTYMQLSKILF